MRLALAKALSEDNRISENKERLKKYMHEAKKEACDIIIFGEAYLQGFEAMTFDYKDDILKSLSLTSEEIAEIRQTAKKESIAVAFGYYENSKGAIYSSYLVIDKDGSVLTNYRRISEGWKELKARKNKDYREGKGFEIFKFMDKKISVMLCGDFFEDDILPKICDIDGDCDIIFWPVHCDYDEEDWTDTEEDEYRKRSEILDSYVIFVNNDRNDDKRVKKLTYVWKHGKQKKAYLNSDYFELFDVF